MSYQQQIYKIIEEISGQNNILTIPVIYIKMTGNIETALILSQLVYWTSRVKNSDGWIYKSNKEWQEEIYLTDYSIRKAIKQLEDMDIIEKVIKKANGSPTAHYRIKKDNFLKSILRIQQIDSLNSTNGHVEFNESITEITTETTTEITTNSLPDSKKSSKIKYAEYVSMTEEEYNKLISQYGEEMVKRMIEILDNYKGATGKRYKSDYRAILNWVVDRTQKEMRGNGKPQGTNKPNYNDYGGYDELVIK